MRRSFAPVLISVLGAAVLTLMPWLVEMLVEALGATSAQAGSLASVQLGGAAVGYVIALLSGRGLGNVRMARLGALLMLMAFAGDCIAHSLLTVIPCWALSGAGAGLVAASAYRSAALEHSPKLIYAQMMTAQMAFGLVAFLLMPRVAPQNQWRVYAVLMTMCIAAMLVSRQLREEPCDNATSKAPCLISTLGPTTLSMATSLLLHFLANSMQWSFFDRIGVLSGIDPTTIARALALSMVGGLGGAALAGIEMKRLPEWLLIAAGIALVIASDVLLLGPTAATYVCAAVLMNFAVMFVQPPYLSFLARLEHGSAAVTWGTLMESLGLMIGPFIGGLLLEHLACRLSWPASRWDSRPRWRSLSSPSACAIGGNSHDTDRR